MDRPAARTVEVLNTDADDGETVKDGTGFGVRMLLDALLNFEPPAVAGKSEL